jgi:hypothetical protein
MLSIILLIYVAIGLIFGLFFISKGVGKIDEDAVGVGWGFRFLILPGSMALWPVLLIKIFTK